MATSTLLIPLTNAPEQFAISLGGTTYTLTVRFNDADDAGWTLDIGDDQNNPIACGIPMVTGVDLLSGLEYLGIPGQLIVATSSNTFAVPTLANLGTDANLYFVTSVSSA